MNQNVLQVTTSSCFGYCDQCKTVHLLSQGACHQYSRKLLKLLENEPSIDLETQDQHRDPQLQTDYLFGKARGKMFGVMECETSDGGLTFIHAFSGQYNGRWLVNGWVEPLFDVDTWHRINYSVEKKIKRLTAEISSRAKNDASIKKLKEYRRKLSRQLMKDIHSIYRLPNFRGETVRLSDLFPNNLPTGTGDCCAPKLLGHAARNNLKPRSMAEFYVGKENQSGSKKHGRFYTSCKEKCQPLLGFMLCGLNK